MSQTERKQPLIKLTEKEKELVEKGKFSHGAHIKGTEELVFRKNDKKIFKKLKHHQDRNVKIEDIE